MPSVVEKRNGAGGLEPPASAAQTRGPLERQRTVHSCCAPSRQHGHTLLIESVTEFSRRDGSENDSPPAKSAHERFFEPHFNLPLVAIACTGFTQDS
jgi:hypothetical protein